MSAAFAHRVLAVTVKGQINFRADDITKQQMEALQKRYGLSQAGVLTMLIRDRCAELKQKEGWDWKKRQL